MMTASVSPAAQALAPQQGSGAGAGAGAAADADSGGFAALMGANPQGGQAGQLLGQGQMQGQGQGQGAQGLLAMTDPATANALSAPLVGQLADGLAGGATPVVTTPGSANLDGKALAGKLGANGKALIASPELAGPLTRAEGETDVQFTLGEDLMPDGSTDDILTEGEADGAALASDMGDSGDTAALTPPAPQTTAQPATQAQQAQMQLAGSDRFAQNRGRADDEAQPSAEGDTLGSMRAAEAGDMSGKPTAAGQQGLATAASHAGTHPAPQSAVNAAQAGPQGDFAQQLAAQTASASMDTLDTSASRLPLDQATVSTAASASAAVRADQIGRDLGLNIMRQIRDGQEEITVRLDPAELGRIHVRLNFADDGTVKLHMRADTSMALELLRRDADQLQRSLSDAGVRADAQGFSFEGGNSGQRNMAGQQNGQGQFGAGRFTQNTPFGDSTEDQARLVRQAIRTAAGRLDMMA